MFSMLPDGLSGQFKNQALQHLQRDSKIAHQAIKELTPQKLKPSPKLSDFFQKLDSTSAQNSAHSVKKLEAGSKTSAAEVISTRARQAMVVLHPPSHTHHLKAILLTIPETEQLRKSREPVNRFLESFDFGETTEKLVKDAFELAIIGDPIKAINVADTIPQNNDEHTKLRRMVIDQIQNEFVNFAMKNPEALLKIANQINNPFLKFQTLWKIGLAIEKANLQSEKFKSLYKAILQELPHFNRFSANELTGGLQAAEKNAEASIRAKMADSQRDYANAMNEAQKFANVELREALKKEIYIKFRDLASQGQAATANNLSNNIRDEHTKFMAKSHIAQALSAKTNRNEKLTSEEETINNEFTALMASKLTAIHGNLDKFVQDGSPKK